MNENGWSAWLVQLREGEFLSEAIGLSAVFALAALVYFVARWLLVRGAKRLAASTETHWDDELVRARVFSKIARIAPALVIFYGIGLPPGVPDALADFVRRVAVACMVVFGALALTGCLAAAERIYDSHQEYRQRSIKSYVQVASLIVYLVTGLLVLSALMNRSPWIFVSGIGAATAVLLLVFRDTILSFVASIQIASNDMIRVGDWIEMPDLGADGDVIEVALHTVKVQNWDKTITTIPTHRLISESFKNWRGMSASGGRRIKRSVALDLQSVRFLTDDEVAGFEQWTLLREYIGKKRKELTEANASEGRNSEVPADLRRLTNLGTLRAWIWATLRSHPDIHQNGYTLLVRQLPPGPQGVSIEVYCFANDTAWVRYEEIQADLFDRILAMIPEFGLRVYQQPAGSDLAALGRAEPERGPVSGIGEHTASGQGEA